jgi:uncharacterized protein (DUF433 family)
MNPKNLAESRINFQENLEIGKAFIKGTKISVAQILLDLYEGKEEADIIRAYRSLRSEDVKAALAFAYCVCDKVELEIKDPAGERPNLLKDPSKERDLKEKNLKEFYTNLESLAVNQKEYTEEYIKKVKEAKKANSPQQIQKAPDKRPYDLIIELNPQETMRLFGDQDELEQGLEMDVDNYIFEQRADGKLWLTYSVKDGIEIDKQMKRNLKVKFNKNGELVDAIYEGYLSTDRKHKIFIAKDGEGKTCGRAL